MWADACFFFFFKLHFYMTIYNEFSPLFLMFVLSDSIEDVCALLSYEHFSRSVLSSRMTFDRQVVLKVYFPD